MGIEDLALMGGLPTFTIIVPGDPASMHAAVKAAPGIKGPVFIRSSRVPMPYIYPMEDTPFEVGKANVVREGGDLTIIGCGMMVSAGLDAAATLEKEGIEARVLDFHTIRPMDVDALTAAAKETGAIVCAEEHLLQGGMGSNIARVIAEQYPVPMRFVGLKDTYVESGDPWDLLQKYNLTAEDIADKAREVLKAKKG
jgi:transketolase